MYAERLSMTWAMVHPPKAATSLYTALCAASEVAILSSQALLERTDLGTALPGFEVS